MRKVQDGKLRGELVELKFMSRAAEFGLRVAKPYGDTAPYDFLVESGGAIFKVQVKSTTRRMHGSRGYACTTRHHDKHYRNDQVDFIAAYIVEESAWYIIPLSALGKVGTVSLNPYFRRNKWREYREAWDLLIPERHKYPAKSRIAHPCP